MGRLRAVFERRVAQALSLSRRYLEPTSPQQVAPPPAPLAALRSPLAALVLALDAELVPLGDAPVTALFRFGPIEQGGHADTDQAREPLCWYSRYGQRRMERG